MLSFVAFAPPSKIGFGDRIKEADRRQHHIISFPSTGKDKAGGDPSAPFGIPYPDLSPSRGKVSDAVIGGVFIFPWASVRSWTLRGEFFALTNPRRLTWL